MKFYSTFLKGLFVVLLPSLLLSCEKDKTGDVVHEEEKVDLVYSEKQRAIVQDFTSTGCPGCGSWGGPTFKEFIQNNPEAVPIAVHIKYGDPMITEESNALGENRTGRKWTPQIAIGHTQSVLLTTSNNINSAGSKKKMQEEYDALVSQEQKVKVAASYKTEGNKMKIYYGADVLEEDNSEYFISAYLMENNLAAYQNGGDSLKVHNHFIRASTDGAFGVPLSGKMELKKELELEASWNWSEVYALAIVWKKNGDKYDYVNAIEATKL